MRKMTITLARRYLQTLKSSRAKYETRETLAAQIGIFADVVAEELSFFDPLINLDYDYDLLQLIPIITRYLESQTGEKKKAQAPRVNKKDVDGFDSVGDFIQQKMTAGGSGLVDKNAKLSDRDLKILKRLVIEEQKRRK